MDKIRQAMTMADWATACGGTILAGDRHRSCDTVVTDTRRPVRDALFVALRGERFDGHRYMLQAAGHGAAGLVVEHIEAPVMEAMALNYPDCCILRVPDTEQAYRDLARAERLRRDVYVIALTGSVGKTTTRDMIAAALGSVRRVHRTRANLNNVIGVPQMIFEMPDDVDTAVLELGMSRPGHIARSSRCAVPDMAIITNIGTSHIGNFKDGRRGILRAKSEILEGLKPGGLLLLNGDEPLLRELAATVMDRFDVAFTSWTKDPATRDALRSLAAACRRHGRSVSAGRIYRAETEALHELAPSFNLQRLTPTVRPGAAETLESADWTDSAKPADPANSADLANPAGPADVSDAVAEMHRETLGTITVPAPGAHQVANALVAVAVAAERGVAMKDAARGLATYTPTGMRQRIEAVGPYTFIHDAYNASPESMAASLRLLRALADRRQGRALAALGTVAEQGDAAPNMHRRLGRTLAATSPDAVYILGDDREALAVGFREGNADLPVRTFEDHASMASAILDQLQPGDCLLIKGSRSYTMERVGELVAAHVTNAPASGHNDRHDQGSDQEEREA